MNANLKEAQILQVNIPLRFRFKHALYTRAFSESVFVKLCLADGTVGYGESLPREYVTGETVSSVIDTLRNVINQKIMGYTPQRYDELPVFIDKLGLNGAARCALELAMLDTFGKYFKKSVYALIDRKIRDKIKYGVAISAESNHKVMILSLACKVYGLNSIKVKVGTNDDVKRLKIVRNILGKGADIRVDANCAWEADEAIKKIGLMRKYKISAVEQPVKAQDYAALKRITEAIPEIVIADESLCSIRDAQKLTQDRICNMFNIRISKCGGLMNSVKIAHIAQRNNMAVQVGCMVGESGILASAGLHLASVIDNLSFCEGANGKFLLKDDITKEDIRFKQGGNMSVIEGNGLGVNIIDKKLLKYAVNQYRIT